VVYSLTLQDFIMAMVAERSASMSMVSLVLLPIDGRSSLVLVYMMGRVWLVFASGLECLCEI
jgi:hypothetical protein